MHEGKAVRKGMAGREKGKVLREEEGRKGRDGGGRDKALEGSGWVMEGGGKKEERIWKKEEIGRKVCREIGKSLQT